MEIRPHFLSFLFLPNFGGKFWVIFLSKNSFVFGLCSLSFWHTVDENWGNTSVFALHSSQYRNSSQKCNSRYESANKLLLFSCCCVIHYSESLSIIMSLWKKCFSLTLIALQNVAHYALLVSCTDNILPNDITTITVPD